MGEKDLSEKILADYNDVFADIFNVLVLKGKNKIIPEELCSTSVLSQYKADDGILHEQERDVSKYWEKQKITLALFGIENQTVADKNMPFRAIGYDGAAYRQQLLKKQKPVPVITLVLHFGIEERWKYPRSIKKLLNIPEYLDDYVNDYKIYIVDIAWLTSKQIAMFKSDFGIVADFFVQKRKNKAYVPEDRRVLQHTDEVLKLLSVMTGDNRYAEVLSMTGKGAITMCDVAERLEQRGIKRGIEQGMEQGIQQGIQQGIRQGIQKGTARTLYHLVSSGNLSVAVASKEMRQTEEDFLTSMKKEGYTVPCVDDE